MAETPGPRNPLDDPDLSRRIYLTLGALALFRVGTFIPLPGVDAGALQSLIDARPGGPLALLNVFSGGALGRFSLFSLGAIPYINASVLVGFLKGGRGDGRAERRLTLFLALLQSFGLALLLARTAAPGGAPLVAGAGPLFYGATTLTLTAGSLFVLWLCEEITESGLGGGAMLIVFAGVVGNFSVGTANLFRLLRLEELGLFSALAIVAALLAAAMTVVAVETAQRKLTVNYAKRIVGRRMYGGAQSSLPLKLDKFGVVSAVSAVVLVASLSAFLPPPLNRGGWIGDAVCAALILFFCASSGSADAGAGELADNLKKSGGSIPGIRPGDSTTAHIREISARAALGGGLLVAAIAVLPDLLRRSLSLPFFFDGVQLLVVVGVALDAMGRVEAHAMRRTYAKFLNK